MTRILALIPAVMMALLAFMIAHIVGEKVSIWAERVLVFIFVLIGAVAAFIVQERRCRRAEAEVARLNVAVSGLKRRIHQSETVVTHTANGVLAIDHNGRITLSNTALEKMFGQSESALLGRKISKLTSTLNSPE